MKKRIKVAKKKPIESVFELFIKHKWTLQSLEDVTKLINSVSTVNLPTTKFLLIKELFNLSKIQAFQYYQCKACGIYTKFEFGKRKNQNCRNCNDNLKKNHFFVYLNVTERIINIIDKYYSEIVEFREDLKNKASITDSYNGKHFNEILQERENLLALQLNTDGVTIV